MAGAFALAAAACSPASFHNVDITGADYARDFALTDQTGVVRHLADYHGRVVVIFFGYTQCPDVCPTTLATLARVRHSLGADADRVQVLFVTLDPGRDTPQLLAQYLPNFDRSFVALSGTPEQIAATAREFKVFYQKVAGPTPSSYTLDHTAGSYVFDRDGHVRLFVRDGAPAEEIADDIKRLLG